LFVGI